MVSLITNFIHLNGDKIRIRIRKSSERVEFTASRLYRFVQTSNILGTPRYPIETNSVDIEKANKLYLCRGDESLRKGGIDGQQVDIPRR